MQDGLAELQGTCETARVYWAMVALYKELFVSYWLLESPGFIYQISASGEGYSFHRSDMDWIPYQGEIPENAEPVSQKEAEEMEDEWVQNFS